MALFEFQLKPLQQVMPWGTEGDLRLSWFGLTDGVYFMNVGEAQLFRNTKEMLLHWKKAYPDIDEDQPFVDYPVVRLYEDLLEKLADVMQPVPLELQKYIATYESQRRWAEQVWDFCYENESDETWEVCALAAEWCGYNRHISTLHLTKGPIIAVWRIDDTVHIRWDNDDNQEDGIAYWTTARGEYCLSADAFMQEVESFHQRFMDAMEQRVQLISTNNPIDPRIEIDVPALLKEHVKRKNSLNDALCGKKPDDDYWLKVMEATEKLLMLLVKE